MADERRYRDEEVREIFDVAASRQDVDHPSVSDERGLTLQELQEVGLEVGMEPKRIAEAAAAVDTRKQLLPRRTHFGMPISVGRVIELPRAVTDREWDVIVAQLRETFGAKGRVSSHGGIREWTNGNLHAFLEPTQTGHRLRLGTLKGSAIPLTRMGAAGLAMALILLTVSVLAGDILTIRGIVLPLIFGGVGGGVLASSLLGLPRWAREREGQMEYLAGRIEALVGEPSQGEE